MNTVTFGVLVTCSIFMFDVSTQRLKYKDGGNQHNFNFSNCNRSAVPFYVQSFKLLPDPIDFQSLIILVVEFNLDRDVGRNGNRIDVDLDLRLKTDRGYTELCEIVGAQNCHFNDLCSILSSLMKKNRCPPFMMDLYQNNCSCPFLQNEYKIHPVLIIIPNILPFQIRGTFDLTVKLQEQGMHVGCIHVDFCVTDCLPLSG